MKKIICIILSLILFSFAFADENSSLKIVPNSIKINRNYFFSDTQSNVFNSTLNKKGTSNNQLQNLSHGNIKNPIKKKKDLFVYLKASPFLLYGGSFGIGKYYLSERGNSLTEKIWVFHYNQGRFISMIYTCGVYFQKNAFISKSRKGLFGILIYGIDYAIVEPSPFEKKTKNKKCIAPNLAAGGGFSFMISDDLYVRISLDCGIKALFTNLNISITF